MITLMSERSHYMGRDKDGVEHLRGELIASTADELSGVRTINNAILEFGSIALTADGKLMLLDEDGTWCDITGDSEVSDNA